MEEKVKILVGGKLFVSKISVQTIEAGQSSKGSIMGSVGQP